MRIFRDTLCVLKSIKIFFASLLDVIVVTPWINPVVLDQLRFLSSIPEITKLLLSLINATPTASFLYE